MIKGIDIGNFSIKDESLNIIESRISGTGNILSSNKIVFNNEIYYLGEGDFNTEYRKLAKDSYIKMLYGFLCTTTKQCEIELVLGLPLSQYKEDKEKLKDLIRCNFNLDGYYKDVRKQYYITDVEVYPEGIASLNNDYEGVIVDIGGRTTDCCLVTNLNNRRKIENPLSLAEGTLNLYSNFINVINNRFGLDLKIKDAERLIKKGLIIKGERQNITFAISVFKDYLESLISKLNIEYSLATNNIAFTGGGSSLLNSAITNRLGYATILDNPVFSNAKGFYKVGCDLWS